MRTQQLKVWILGSVDRRVAVGAPEQPRWGGEEGKVALEAGSLHVSLEGRQQERP